MSGLKVIDGTPTSISKFLREKEDNISPCLKCNCMTHSIRKGRAYYICGKCGADKSLSDVFFYEATQRNKKMPPVCSVCKTPMKNAIDFKTKKISKYLWELNCDCLKNKGRLLLSRG